MKQAFHFILNLTADRFRKRFKKFRDRFVILIFILCVQLFPVRCPKPGQTFFMNLQLALNHHHSQNGITRIVLPPVSYTHLAQDVLILIAAAKQEAAAVRVLQGK